MTEKTDSKQNMHHILVDDTAFEKFKTFRQLVSHKLERRVNSSVLLDALISIAVENFESSEEQVISHFVRALQKRNKKIEKKEDVNIDELLKKLKE